MIILSNKLFILCLNLLAGKIIGPTVCGYCGLTIGLTSSSTKGGDTRYKATSNCDYFEKFNLKSAETSAKSMPCTNRLINCPHTS